MHTEGALDYLLWIRNDAGSMTCRQQISGKVSVSLLWQGISESARRCALACEACDLEDYIHTVPCDQGYGEKKMVYICNFLVYYWKLFKYMTANVCYR